MLPFTYLDAAVRSVTPVCPTRQRLGVSIELEDGQVFRFALDGRDARFLKCCLDDYMDSPNGFVATDAAEQGVTPRSVPLLLSVYDCNAAARRKQRFRYAFATLALMQVAVILFASFMADARGLYGCASVSVALLLLSVTLYAVYLRELQMQRIEMMKSHKSQVRPLAEQGVAQ